MTFNVDAFRQELAQRGYVKQHDFEVEINLPKILLGRTIRGVNGVEYPMNTARVLRWRIDATKAPGVLLATTETRRYGIGPIQKNPYSSVFTDDRITIIPDKDGFAWNFFYVWMNSAFNYADGMGPTGGGDSRFASYELGYREDYETEMRVKIYAPDGKPVQSMVMNHTYPVMMPDVPLSWGAHDRLIRLDVNFTFRAWSLESVTSQPGAARPQNDASLPVEDRPFVIP